MPDIETRDDIIRLIDAFYTSVRKDELLGPVFDHVDWPRHMPTMYNFWASMLLGDNTYQGSPFQKHIHLEISVRHFDRWLSLFDQTVDEHFGGPKSDEAKARAKSIAGIFQYKLGLMVSN